MMGDDGRCEALVNRPPNEWVDIFDPADQQAQAVENVVRESLELHAEAPRLQGRPGLGNATPVVSRNEGVAASQYVLRNQEQLGPHEQEQEMEDATEQATCRLVQEAEGVPCGNARDKLLPAVDERPLPGKAATAGPSDDEDDEEEDEEGGSEEDNDGRVEDDGQRLAPAPAAAAAAAPGAAPAVKPAAAPKKPRKVRTTWTPERVALFNYLTQKKHGASYVAKALGMAKRTVQNMRAKLLTMDSETPGLLVMATQKAAVPAVERESTRKMKEAILQICREDHTYTVRGITARLLELGISKKGSSPTNVMRIMRDLGLTKKNLVHDIDARNLLENIIERRVFCEELSQIPEENVLYLDECAFNNHTTPRQGWAPNDAPAIYTRPASRSGNVTLLLTIGLHGPVEWSLVTGDSVASQRFSDYVTVGLLPALEKEPWGSRLARGTRWCIVMDIASIHNTVETQSLFQDAGIRLLFLTPHSLLLNPMEDVLGVLRTKCSRECTTTAPALLDSLGRILKEMKGTSMRGYYDRAARYYPDCMAGLPLVSKPSF